MPKFQLTKILSIEVKLPVNKYMTIANYCSKADNGMVFEGF